MGILVVVNAIHCAESNGRKKGRVRFPSWCALMLLVCNKLDRNPCEMESFKKKSSRNFMPANPAQSHAGDQ